MSLHELISAASQLCSQRGLTVQTTYRQQLLILASTSAAEIANKHVPILVRVCVCVCPTQGAQGAVAMAKYSAPNMAQRVVDTAIQVHGGAGVSQVRDALCTCISVCHYVDISARVLPSYNACSFELCSGYNELRCERLCVQDTVLARLWTAARTLRIADGPDEVHLGTIAKLELARVSKL